MKKIPIEIIFEEYVTYSTKFYNKCVLSYSVYCPVLGVHILNN